MQRDEDRGTLAGTAGRSGEQDCKHIGSGMNRKLELPSLQAMVRFLTST